jgi:hypothetical protein
MKNLLKLTTLIYLTLLTGCTHYSRHRETAIVLPNGETAVLVDEDEWRSFMKNFKTPFFWSTSQTIKGKATLEMPPKIEIETGSP